MTARRGNLLGFLACACLLAYAYYAQFVHASGALSAVHLSAESASSRWA